MPITLDGSNGITTPTYGGADTSEYLVPVTQFKNRIINGAMMIDQRNAGASVTSGFAVDRFNFQENSGSAFTIERSTTAPAGFTNSVLITVTTAASATAAQVNRFFQRIEGFNTADLGFGTANAKTVTLSFWARASLTGTYCASLVNSAADRSYVSEYTINSANTWEYKTITITGDTAGTWLTDNGVGIQVIFDFGSGSDYNATAGSWVAAGDWTTTNQVNFANTNGATFFLTGCQLEIGSTATSFDYRPYGTELALCQRYYYKINAADSSTGNAVFGSAYANTTTVAGVIGKFPVTMRTYPTALEQSGTAAHYQVQFANTNTTCSAVATYSASTSTEWWRITATVASGLTAGQGGMLFGNSLSAYLAWSAEL